MFGPWFTSQLTPQSPGLWLLFSLLLSALLLSMRMWMPPRFWSRAWFAHWLLVPYLGLLLGGLSPRLLGLAAIDWLASMGLGVGLTFGVIVLLVTVRAFVDLDPTGNLQAHLERPRRRRFAALTAGVGTGRHIMTSTVLWGGITQFHWVFLRGAIWEMLLTLPQAPSLPGYWAIWAAFFIGLLELLLMRTAFIPLLIQIITLITTGILYFYTRNFWLCWMLHVAIQFIVTPPAWLPPAPHRLTPQRR